PHGGGQAAGGAPVADAGRDRRRPRGQPVPLHRLLLHRQRRRAGRGCGRPPVSIGTAARRVDGTPKVTGAAQYPADRPPAGSLVAKVVFSGRPHARMLAMDTAAAEAVPGVVMLLTAADVPVNEYGLTMRDQPVLVGVGATGRSDAPSDVSRWEADHIAVV